MRLIDADEFIKDECNHCDGACESMPCDCLECKADCRCDFIKDIVDAPTVDAVPVRHGKWNHSGSHWKYDYLCSKCDFQIRGEIPEEYKFCPNCGAWMDGGDDA